MPGPLPEPNARRRNSPTVPTTNLPAGGRKGRPPAVPEGYNLRENGTKWWRYAWATPQAVSWDAGARFAVARRASLEDDLAILDSFDPFELAAILDVPESRQVKEVAFVVGRIKALAAGRLAVMKEMRELEMQLGLGPKALAALRWKIVAEEKPAQASRVVAPAVVDERRLRAV